ncbi:MULTISPECIES: hypothetical protein [Pseudoalteromonas]|uniref:ATP synthase F0 subunit B n=1 Tax=Pseudoalteromonas arctica TaxID=394751 RepID=A0A7Y0DUD6_9GAMM|nr:MULTISPECIES: hypothetical protein [Pseudoalteromonas]MDN3402061.1 hypothetical protein [Pseudoalteromonas sp. APC 3213]NMM41759.1 ATP synthase F0 subunit B [Pseudoalteromonas arctica]
MWKNILVAALSALFTFAGSYYFYSESLAISKLDLHKDYDDNYFSKPKFPSDDIILTVNKIEKEKIGLLQISLLNYTAKDYLDIPINFKLTPKELSNFKVLAYSVVGHGDVNDLVKEPKKMEFDGNSFNFSFKVSAINRTEKSDYGIQLRILFEGTEEPNIRAFAKGVGIRDFDINNSPYQETISKKSLLIFIGALVCFCLVMFIMMIFILNPVMSIMTRKSDIKSRQKYAESLFLAIKKENLLPGKTDPQIAEFIADMLHRRQCEWWDKRSPIAKWSLGLMAPERKEHLF